jgi:hypothetical protein
MVEIQKKKVYTKSTQTTKVLMLVHTSHIHAHPHINVHHV